MEALELYMKSDQSQISKTRERRSKFCSGVYIDKFVEVYHIVVVFPFLTLNN